MDDLMYVLETEEFKGWQSPCREEAGELIHQSELLPKRQKFMSWLKPKSVLACFPFFPSGFPFQFV